jgi:hypothetical protein
MSKDLALILKIQLHTVTDSGVLWKYTSFPVKFFDISQDSFLSSMPEYPMSVLKMALWTLSYDCDLIILKYNLFI